VEGNLNNIQFAIESLKSDSHLEKLKSWLSPPDPSTNANEARKQRHQGTGAWFLTSQSFIEWKSGLRQYLWLHGMAGCGKTVLCSTILDHLSEQDSSCITLNFFFDFSDKDKQLLDKLLRSLTFQLYSQCADSRKELDMLYASHEEGKKQPTTESLSTVLKAMTQFPKKLRILLDALDECTARKELLDWMKSLSGTEFTDVQIIATSRLEQEIESHLSRWVHKEDIIPIERNPVHADILSYIQARLNTSKDIQERWSSKPSILEEIVTALGERADGM